MIESFHRLFIVLFICLFVDLQFVDFVVWLLYPNDGIVPDAAANEKRQLH